MQSTKRSGVPASRRYRYFGELWVAGMVSFKAILSSAPRLLPLSDPKGQEPEKVLGSARLPGSTHPIHFDL
jgi:hypothetical protein